MIAVISVIKKGAQDAYLQPKRLCFPKIRVFKKI